MSDLSQNKGSGVITLNKLAQRKIFESFGEELPNPSARFVFSARISICRLDARLPAGIIRADHPAGRRFGYAGFPRCPSQARCWRVCRRAQVHANPEQNALPHLTSVKCLVILTDVTNPYNCRYGIRHAVRSGAGARRLFRRGSPLSEGQPANLAGNRLAGVAQPARRAA